MVVSAPVFVLSSVQAAGGTAGTDKLPAFREEQMFVSKTSAARSRQPVRHAIGIVVLSGRQVKLKKRKTAL